MIDVESLTNLLLYGGSEEGSAGGLQSALSLNADHIVYEQSSVDRPSYPFVSFTFPVPVSGPLYGPKHNPAISVSEIEDEPTECTLSYDNAKELILHIYLYGQLPDQTPYSMATLASLAVEYFDAQADWDLDMAGIPAHVSQVGEIRDASTILHEEWEIRLGIDVRVVGSDTFTVKRGAIQSLDWTFKFGDEPESSEEEVEL